MSESNPGATPPSPEGTPTRKEPEEAPPASSVRDAHEPHDTHDYRTSGQRPVPSAQPGETPQAFGRYTVRGVLGHGAFGTVYHGHDSHLDRPVAIKVQHSQREFRAEEFQAFLQEARRLARLRHPGIVAVHDVGEQDQRVYIISDLVQGVTLKEWFKTNRLSWQEALRIVAAVADALAHAHVQRMVHRDIKPANILLTAELLPIVVDFGLGLDESESPDHQRGMIMGTPAYMSPEQASGRGHRIDGRTDIYSLGVILYELLTGQLPFRAVPTDELLRQVREDEPQPPRQLVPHLPRELEIVCLKAMAKTIHERYTTAGDMAQELRQLLMGHQAAVPPSAEHATMHVPLAHPTQVTQPEPPAAAKDSSRQSGSSLPRAQTSSTTRAAQPERRQLTLVVCRGELFESAPYLEGLEDEEQLDILRSYQQLGAAIVERYEGVILQRTEQGFLACFGYPTAQEDAASRAVRAGLGILHALRALEERLQRDRNMALNASVAVHTGMCVISAAEGSGREAFAVTGEGRNVSARLEAVARPWTVVISQTTHRLIQGFFVCESLGPFAIKAMSRPLDFHRVVRESDAQSRVESAMPAGLSPLIGRDREVGLLQDRWEQALEGMGQVVLLIGEAGLGKSRLVHVLKEQLARHESTSAFTVVEWRCTPYHQNSVLFPASDFFSRLLHFEREETPAQRFVKLLEHLQQYRVADEAVVPYLAALLALPLDGRYALPELSPARLKEKTLEALLTWLNACAARQPVLFIVEDLHWVDPSTLEFLALHVERGLKDRMLTVLTFRPEFETPWKSRSHQSVIALNRLTRRQIADLMQRKTGVAQLPAALVEQMAAKTDGVPFFVEEYTQVIMESGRLATLAGAAEISSSFLRQDIPATLQDLLVARLNRMASNREVVQLGATLGREFTYELLRAISELEEEMLRTELDKLVAAELLYQKGTPPQCCYLFKHALLQDAAYLTLLKSKRQEVHRRVAEVLEQHFPETAQNQPELLAHHFTEAGRSAPGIDYWVKAGLRAKDRSANEEAVSHLRCALKLLARLPASVENSQRELQVLIPLGTALIASRGYAAPEVGPVFERARTLCQQLGQTTSLMAILWGIWAWRVVREELDLCLEGCAEVMRLAESQPVAGILMEAHFVSGLTWFYRGEPVQALEHLKQGIALHDNASCRQWSHYTGQNSRITQGSYQALCLWHLGYPDQALRVGEETVELAQQLGHPYSLAFAWHHLGWLHQYYRQGKSVQASAEAALAVASEQNFPFWKATASLCRSFGLLLQQRPAEALEQALQALAVFRATGAELSIAHYASSIAEAYAQLGRYDEALRWIEEARAASAKNRNEFYLAEILRLQGEFLRVSSADLSEVESCFHAALAVAKRQGARSWQLRASMSLGRLWHQQGRRGEARQQLLAIHQTFTEGFATADLVEAQKLLDGWAATEC